MPEPDDKSLFNVSDRSDPTPAAVDMSELERHFTQPQAQNPDQGVPFPASVTPPETRSWAGEFVSGLKAGWSQLGTDLRSTAAMGLALTGWEKDALELMRIVQDREAQDEKDFPRSIQRIEDVDSIGDLARWAARNLGEQIPVIGSMFIGGAGGRVMGQLVGRGAMSLGLAPQIAAKFPLAFTGVDAAAAVPTAAQRGAQIGTALGVFGTNTALETGNTASDLFEATGKLQPEASFIAGISKGALESLVPWMIGSRLGLDPLIARGLSTRVMQTFDRILPGRIGGALGIGGTEAVTEALQEAVDIAARSFVDEHYDWLGPDARSRILNSAAAGLFVGSTFGLAHRGNRHETPPEARTPIMPQEFGVGNPDISTGEDSTGVPSVSNIRLGQEPGNLPELNNPHQVLPPVESKPIAIGAEPEVAPPHEYNPAIAPGPLNTTGQYTTPDEVTKRRGLDIKENPKATTEHYQAQFAADPNLRTTTGENWDPSKAAPGSVTVVNNVNQSALQKDGGATTTVLERIAKFLQMEMQRIGIKDKSLSLHDTTVENPDGSTKYPPAFTSKPRTAAHINMLSNGAMIVMNTASIKDYAAKAGMSFEQAAFLSAAHEFGHFLSYNRLRNADPEVVQRIRAEYERHLLAVTFGDARYMGYFFNPESQAFLEKRWKEKYTQEGFKVEDPNYVFSFEEWFAENVSKYYSEAYGQQKPLIRDARVRSFFIQLAKDIRGVFERLAKMFGKNTADSVREFMDSLRRSYTPVMQSDGRFMASASLISQAVQENEAAGIQQNAEILGTPAVSNGEFVPPPQVATGGLGRLLNRLGIPGLKGREIRAFADKFTWYMNLGFNLEQIAQQNPHIGPLQRYREWMGRWYSFQMNWMGRADQRVREWMSLGKQQKKNLAQFLFALDGMEYLTPEERQKGISRQPTPDELRGLATKYGLNDAALQQYQRIKEDFDAVLDQIEATSIRDIDRTISDAVTNAQEKANLAREMAALRARPYFPHARFGDWAVVVKDKQGGKTVYMEQFESQNQAAAAAPEILRDLQRKFPGATARADYIPKEVHGFRGLPPNLIARIKERLKLSETQNEWLDNLIVDMAPSASFRHHLQKRMNTPGFSLNAMRAYASYFFHGARHLARIEFGPLMQEEVTTGMNQSITGLEAPGVVVDVTKRRRIQEYMANHLEHILNPKPDWAQLRSAAFLWYLGFNPSSALLNLTQPILVGLPYLSARFGDRAAMGAMIRATKDLRNVYKYKERDRVSDELLRALDRAMKEGVVEESQAAELAATAQGGYLAGLIPGTRLQRGAQMMAHYGGWMFQQSERLNRRMMFRAAWELAMKEENRNLTHLRDLEATNTVSMGEMLDAGFSQVEARAYLAAKDAVDRTQFGYGVHQRPKFMRGKLGVIFTFFMFTQNMLYFARYSPGNVRYLAMMLFLAGLMGLPGAEDAEALAKLIARNFLGKQFDLQREVRELVTGMLGDSIPPDLFLHGVGRVGFGLPAMMDLLGLPKAQFDFSRRIGFGRIIPGLSELGAPGVDFDQAMSRVSTQAAGATFGIGFNIIKALTDDQLPANDFKRWERMMPTSLANLAKVLRYATEGRERSRTDATIVDYNITDPDHLAELALRAVGFQPTRVQREWDRIQMQRETEAYWTSRRSLILKLWDHSFGVGDPDLRERALDDVRSYNAEVPFGAMRITGEQLAKSRKEHLRQTRLREAGLTNAKAMRPLAREIESLHPETRAVTLIDAVEVN